jgi:hypothetical protein
MRVRPALDREARQDRLREADDVRHRRHLGRLRLVAVEQLGEQGVELLPFGRVEALEELVLDGVGVLLQFLEVLPAGVGEGDDVAAPIR